MNIERCLKDTFVVIGKEGSTNDGEGFIKKLWEDANSSFHEVSHLAKRDDNGNILGIWGAMSDFSHAFNPWQNNFTQGLYLAGVECNDNSEEPEGWNKWIIPGYEYLYAENDGNDTFSNVLRYMEENRISLSGAVHDFNCSESGKGYIFFPIRRL